ncbi:MAG: ATP-dependent DNA ligase [Verrucomicrobiae bacterium]|nr:ATP-dependent DNA ligase [Verrucomicrobiae bacterium]
MKRFSQLFSEIDQTNRTNEKVAALVSYFQDVPAGDASWALYFLSEKRLSRPVTGRQLLQWASNASGYSSWLLEECYDRVGDFAETVSLLVNAEGALLDLPLHTVVDDHILPLATLDEHSQRNLIVATWKRLDAVERLLYMKLITGGFRMGVAKTLVVRALSEFCGVDKAILSHRLMGSWQPCEEDFARIVSPDTNEDLAALPYPFFLAYPWEQKLEETQQAADFRTEWKWDGIRCQLLKRNGAASLWSRGEEMITEQFPEIVQAAGILPDGTVLDGEIVVWKEGQVQPFGELQNRLGRKRVTAAILQALPVAFVAYDLLEAAGGDIRGKSLDERMALLDKLVASEDENSRIMRFPPLPATSWKTVADFRRKATDHGTEGVMIKRRTSIYGVGRKKGDWYKWKVDPFTIDAVLIYAQQGHGRRASLFTDYTFGVWDKDELVPVAKAYSGLTDAEIQKVDAFIKKNTVGRKGPVRVVKPELVFELAFEGIRASGRHRSGVAFRFPRISRMRKDKPIAEADTLETVCALLPAGEEAMKPNNAQMELDLNLSDRKSAEL